MLKEITLPEIAENVKSGIVVEILVSEGDTIEAEQPIVELETDKATFEVPSTDAGVIKDIKVSEGDEVKVGEIIVTLETNDEEVKQEKDETTEKEEEPKKTAKEEDKEEDKEELKEKEKGDHQKEENEKKEEKPEEEEDDQEGQQKREPPKSEDDKKREHASDVPAAPSVRRFARELGIDIHQVKGSGPGGRISKEDVEKHKKGGKEEAPQEEPKEKVAAEELPDFSKWGSVNRQALTNIRRITAETMQKSWQSIPHVTQFDQADISTVESFMEKYASKAEKEGGKLTITAILLKLCATALHSFPRFNASIDMQNQELVYKKYCHIGIAVDTPQGLLVPVIRDVDKKSVFRLSAEVTEIAKKARDKKINPEELQGGNFTISNLGGIGGTNFTPIVYPPQVAILGVARASKQPVYQNSDNKFVPHNILPLSLSYDHRAIDGAEGARFLRWICNALEDPFLALMEGGM